MSEEGEKGSTTQEMDEKASKEKSRSSRHGNERRSKGSRHRSSSRDSNDELGTSERKSSGSRPERRRSKDADDLGGKSSETRSSGRPSRRKSRDSHDGEPGGAEGEKGRRSSNQPERRRSKDSDELGGKSEKRSSGRPSRRKSRDSHDGDDNLETSEKRSSKHRSRSRDSNDSLAADNDSSAFTEDQRAKARSRRSSSGAAVPGAFVETSAGESRAARQKRDSSRKDKESAGKGNKQNREAEDRDAKNRARRPTGGTNASSSTRASRDLSAKKRARSGAGPATRPGASSEARGNRQAKLDLSNVRNLTPDLTPEPSPTPQRAEDEVEINAIAVGEEENEQLKQQQKEIENLKRTLTQISQNQNENTDETQEARNEDKNGTSSSARKKCICLVVVLLLIGGGIAGYLLGTRGKNVVEPATVDVAPTSAPTEKATEPQDPTLPSPTSPPTAFQQFDAPSPEDCAAIESGGAVDGQDLFQETSFAMELDVTLLSEPDEGSTYLPVLKNALQAIFMPEVAGCSVSRRRNLRDHQRKLQLEGHVVANGLILELSVPPTSSCQTPNLFCVRVVVTMDLWLREQVKGFLLVGHLGTVLGPNPVDKMNLQTLFESIVLITGYETTPTDLLSVAPTGFPSLESTPSPSASFSTNPSFAPVIGPTTEQPTRKPTTAPTGATPTPSTNPTMAPIVGPSPPPTPQPTPEPTPQPTPEPTPPPTPWPTLPPTPGPTKAPSPEPSTSPSKTPTNMPSLLPTESPTDSPSKVPTAAPTPMPSLLTPTATAFMSSEYTCEQNICNATGHLSIPDGHQDKAMNGNTDGDYSNDSCMQTFLQYNPWWRVRFSDFRLPTAVSQVVIWNRNDDLQDNIIDCEVELLDVNENVLASSTISSSAASTTHTFADISGVKGVRVIQPKTDQKYQLNMCEVQVFGPSGEDWMANDPWKFAWQSSNIGCALTCTSNGWQLVDSSAGRAIDGITANTWGDGLAHSWLQYFPWWGVDLGFSATVHRVIIYNRSDHQENMLTVFLELLDDSGQIIHSQGITEELSVYTIEFPGGIQNVASVRLQKYINIPHFVYFAEMEVFGYQE